MKKLLLTAVTAGLLSQTAFASDYDRYFSVGIGSVNYDRSGYSDGKSVHGKLGLCEKEGFGMEFEYSQTIDPLTSATRDLDITTYATYATYKVGINGEFSLKGRLGFLDQTIDSSDDANNWEYPTDISYGLSINYEPVQDQVVYLDYTVSKPTWGDLTVISVGMQFLF